MFPTCAGNIPSLILNDVQKQDANASNGWRTEFKIMNGDPKAQYIIYQNLHMIYNVSHDHIRSFDTKYSEAWVVHPTKKSADSILVPRVARNNAKGSIKIYGYAWIEEGPLAGDFINDNIVYAGTLPSKGSFKDPPRNRPILYRHFFARWDNIGKSVEMDGRDICLVDRIMEYRIAV